jgi:hypothetical protein
MCARYPATQDQDVCWRHSRHASEQDASSALRLFQTICTNLRGKASRDFRHRRQQWQPGRWRCHGLICNAGCAARNQVVGLLKVRREMQIGEKYLPASQLLAFGRKWLLYFNNQLGLGEDAIRSVYQRRARRAVVLIAEPSAYASSAFDQYSMIAVNEFRDRRRDEADSILVVFDLLRHAEQHDSPRNGCHRSAPDSALNFASRKRYGTRDCILGYARTASITSESI